MGALQWWVLRTPDKVVSQAEALTLLCSYSSLRPDSPSLWGCQFVQEQGGEARAGVLPTAVQNRWSWKLSCLGLREGETLEGKQFQSPMCAPHL